jgi:hypothetical protein
MSFLTVVPAIGFALLVASSYIRKVKGAIDYVTDGIRRTRGLSARSSVMKETPLEMVTTSSTASTSAGKALSLPESAISTPSVAVDNDNGIFSRMDHCLCCVITIV